MRHLTLGRRSPVSARRCARRAGPRHPQRDRGHASERRAPAPARVHQTV